MSEQPGVEIAMRLARLLALLVQVPMRAVIRHLNRRRASNGVASLNTFQRGAVYVFVSFCAVIVCVAFTTSGATPIPAEHTVAAKPATTDQVASGMDQVTVARVIDGDTVELGDGRTVRLLGVDAPEADTCEGLAATAFARSQVEGQPAQLLLEPGVTTDQYGRTLAYLTYGPGYGYELGLGMVRHGWADPYIGGDANTAYVTQVHALAKTAQQERLGVFAAPCREPVTEPAPEAAPAAPADIDVDLPNTNLPDGALTGGFCARKKWC